MRILTVSRLCKSDSYKSIDLVIEAVKQLDFCTLTIVGDGDDRVRLDELSEHNPRIVFVGNVTDEQKHVLYEECDVFCLPSTKEGFGIVFVEAMMHGKPCIGANAGAAPEVIDHGVTGYVIKSDDLGELIHALRVLTDKIVRLSMGCNAVTRAQSLFSYDRFKSRVKELLA